MKPHRHQSLIIQWANGAKIQYRKPDELVWKDSDTPAWVEGYEYRVKPSEVMKAYPVTKMTYAEMNHEVAGISDRLMALGIIANTALRHAIDAGQVVTREEFDRLADINATLRKAIPFKFD